MDKITLLLFAVAITIHNIEEAIWLPQWSQNARKFHPKVTKKEFRFAVVIITVLAYLATASFIAFPNSFATRYYYFGFVGAMMLNLFSHLIPSIVLKNYSPGLLTSLLLIIPTNSYLLYYGVSQNLISIKEIVISSIIVAVVLLLLIPVLFKLSHVIPFKQKNRHI